MILNIYGDPSQNQLNILMPNITLDHRFRYQIGVHRVYFELNDAKNLQQLSGNHDILIINSNLVDRSATNPHQALVYFDVSKNDRKVQSFCSRSVIFQPLLMYELANASFNICLVSGQQAEFNFKHFFLQLEIRKSESYGWV